MFSGIVEEVGVVAAPAPPGGGRLRVTAPGLAGRAHLGDSIAVNGCCLTVSSDSAAELIMDVVAETARRTTLVSLRAGDAVNLEAALTLGRPLGGHLVTGHVDAVGTVTEVREEGDARWITVAVPHEIAALMTPRGSVALDGISLTVTGAGDASLSASIIPHTLAATSASGWRPGTPVNVEADILARYVQRALEVRLGAAAGGGRG